ncbi:hypothetical protein, partial [Blastococcus sp. CCUG 61487]|uniref:phosphoketolase family protein n=1 Tax=Blastococcus sp. CCUG 61487 TaxID=1840703 RepID=UPI0010C09697
NVVDLMRLQDERAHPHGLSDAAFDALFTRDKPVVFAYHGYPWLIHRLTYRRSNHENFHVRGYVEERLNRPGVGAGSNQRGDWTCVCTTEVRPGDPRARGEDVRRPRA